MTNSMFYPLGYFYDEMRVPFPALRQAAPVDLREPARSLLVHERDMTPTLEAAHGGKLELRVLRCKADENAMNRLVALVLESEQKTIALGAIHIFLQRLPPAARNRVLERRDPFGRILHETGVTHHSRPVAYFEVNADTVIMRALGMQESCVLHGRRSTIWNTSGEELADVVEILAPPTNLENGRVS